MSRHSHINTGLTVAIVMAAMISIALCIVWIFRNSKCLCNRRSMLRRLNSIRLPNLTDGTTITLSDTCVHSSTSLPTKSLERPKCPASPSCTSQHTPSVECIRTLQPHPGHPSPHCVLDNARFSDRIIIDNPRDITLKSSAVSYQGVETRMLLQAMLPDAISQTVGKTEEMPVMPLDKCVSPKTCKSEVNHDALTACCTSDLEKTTMPDSERSDSGTSIMEGNSDPVSMNTWRTSLVRSPGGTLSSSTVCEFVVPKLSMSFEHGRLSFTKAQVRTPPHTPPTIHGFSLTTLSSQYNLRLIIRDTLNKHYTEDIRTWSDVLSVAEYEQEEHLINARKGFSFQNHLPSPPSTPTMGFAHPSAQSLSSNTVIQETRCLSAGSTSYLPLERGLFVDVRSTDDVHQCNGDDYSFAHMQETNGTSCRGLPIDLEVGDEDNNCNDELPPYQSFGFDYEARLAIKRATSLLAKPVRSEASSTRIVLRQVASAVRPRPPVVEYKPLLLRPVDRSRIKPRTGLLGYDVAPLTEIKKKIPKSTRERSRTTEELSPHVHVLEELIEHVSERRTGDIALGTV